jgi:hypothetical protein
VDLEVENIVGSYGPREHDACVLSLPNGGHLNQVFEKASIAYSARSAPGTEASTEASKKRKVDDLGKNPGKRAKVATKKKAGSTKVTMLKPNLARNSPQKLSWLWRDPSKQR